MAASKDAGELCASFVLYVQLKIPFSFALSQLNITAHTAYNIFYGSKTKKHYLDKEVQKQISTQISTQTKPHS